MRSPTVLFVAFPFSVHTARWVSQLHGSEWHVELFASAEGQQHEDLKMPVHEGDAAALARLVCETRPDVVHSMEIQHGGYLTLKAKTLSDSFPPWVVSNWGSDISLFGRLPEHAARIRAVMESCDFYHCECHRDLALARKFGFRGVEWPIIPVGGGLNVERWLREPFVPPSRRRVVALKGYQSWAGRAQTALAALRRAGNELRDYELALYVADEEMQFCARLYAADLRLRVVPPCTHEEMLKLHAASRVSIGLSISDGISTSLIEAMLMGSFPVQSGTGCACEWVEDGQTAFVIRDPMNPEEVGEALCSALRFDSIVDRAAEINRRTVAERCDGAKIREQVLAEYRRALG
ncbi:MAG TPA: glycosyltransferase [Pyrinomonadaceae bacterium]|jgi:hypothetical protein|nr:glycosyltransferase [Pyrinomonadaceae bacterium]